MGELLDPFRLHFMQTAVAEVLLLAIPAGLLGTWIVLRRLAFLTHALGSATFPGLVVGVGLGFSPWLGAIGATAAFVGLQAGLERRTRLDGGVVTAVLLAAALATGSILTSNVFGSGAAVDTLLFGSLLGIGTSDLVRTGLVAAVALAFTLLATRGLLAVSFSPALGGALGYRRARQDALLFAALGLVVIATASAVGGLVVSGLLVVPAATARLLVHRVARLQLLACLLAGAEGVAGLRLALALDVPPGATIAVLAASVHLLVAGGLGLRRGARRPAPLAEPA